MSKYTHFGFRKVLAAEKQDMVNGVFNSVAKKYNLMNDLMSFGLHRYWKRKFIKELDLSDDNIKILDNACGTCDIPILIHKINNNIQIHASDINQNMLDIASKRVDDSVILKQYDGGELPYNDNTFDYYTIAFGIRNFEDVQKGVEEAYRVLKPNGKFICLEFSKVNNKALAILYKFYLFKVIPLIGKIVAKDCNSYKYLAESIHNFPPQNEFKKIIEKCGLENVEYKNMTFGTVSIHIGEKLN